MGRVPIPLPQLPALDGLKKACRARTLLSKDLVKVIMKEGMQNLESQHT
jgi:hypothetical protein